MEMLEDYHENGRINEILNLFHPEYFEKDQNPNRWWVPTLPVFVLRHYFDLFVVDDDRLLLCLIDISADTLLCFREKPEDSNNSSELSRLRQGNP
jgi:hypothetical protein